MTNGNHDVWIEPNEDLLVTLGRNRDEDEER
jgi:hypothetical protein